MGFGAVRRRIRAARWAAAGDPVPRRRPPLRRHPSELQDGVDELLAEEPEHGEPGVVSSTTATAARRTATAHACGVC